MHDDQERLMEVFNEARTKASDEERDAYLAAECGSDDALRRQVETLLKAHTKLGDFLKPPSDDPAITEGPGTVIGRYKLLEQIGEGGFGVVFMAEQMEPIRRKVALKIVKPGMDTKQVIARFEAERQALAMMDHPNIARVFDAGATGSGRPYFVMELVQGVPLTRFCDANELSPPERLQLIMQVCRAVQHAHQKGVIHRDLKPSNILVTLHDGKPVPKVIDFGTAKALQQPLTDKTLFTAYGRLIGTPQYMSPEQAELSGLDVDTRADIYSLGVLLYELLTGTTPFEIERLRAAAFEEMMRIIRQEDPPKPSTRVSTLGERATEIAKHRQMDANLLRRSLRGDLDWIVMKCLEKDRARRYETANSLAVDVENHLNDEPVLARPPSRLYRFQKLVRRNKLAFTAGTAGVLVLACIASAAWFLAKERSALQNQDQANRTESEWVGKMERELNTGHFREAREAANQALQLGVNHERVNKLLELVNSTEQRNADYSNAMVWARQMLGAGKFDDAVSQGQLALKAKPDDTAAGFLIEGARGKIEENRKHAEYIAAMAAARLALKEGRFDDGHKAADGALQLGINNEEANKLIEQINTTKQQNKDYSDDMAKAKQALRESRFADALEVANRALQLGVDNDSSQKLLAQIPVPLDLRKYLVTSAAGFSRNQRFPAWRFVPIGLQIYHNVPFQIDGNVCLYGEGAAKAGLVFPGSIRGIPVTAKFETLYVYHASFYASPPGTPVYHLVFRYQDGSSATNYILSGGDVLDWYGGGTNGPTAARSMVAWRGEAILTPTNSTVRSKQPLRFCMTAVENPFPAATVMTIDLFSCKKQSAGCVMALTRGPAGLMRP